MEDRRESRLCSTGRVVALLCALVLTVVPALADEKSLVEQFNKAVGLTNEGRFVESRRELDRFVEQAQKVPQNDPAYDRAQELLSRVTQITNGNL